MATSSIIAELQTDGTLQLLAQVAVKEVTAACAAAFLAPPPADDLSATCMAWAKRSMAAEVARRSDGLTSAAVSAPTLFPGIVQETMRAATVATITAAKAEILQRAQRHQDVHDPARERGLMMTMH